MFFNNFQVFFFSDFFCAIFSFLDMSDFIYDRFWCMTSCIQMTEEIFAKLIHTLTSEARVLDPKTCGVQGAAPVGSMGGKASHQIFFSKWINSWTTFFQNFKCSYFHERCGMCWSECKIYFPIFSIFIYWVMFVFTIARRQKAKRNIWSCGSL